MEYEDEEIICKDCKEVFIYSAGEKIFMHDLFIQGKFDKPDGTQGKVVPPKRCPECRREHKSKYKN